MKKYIPALLFAVAAVLACCFAINLYLDYTCRYEYGSAPFSLYIAEGIVKYIFPAIAAIVVGILFRRTKK